MTDTLREAAQDAAELFDKDCRLYCSGDWQIEVVTRLRAALAAASQPAPVDRGELVRLLQIITRNGSLDDGRTLHEVIADALLARGLRLPDGGETMAWAVVRKGASLDIHTLFDERPDPKTWRLPKDAEVVRVAICVVEGGDDAA